ncbi:hypothetical protein IFM89_011891 [Coptis chinensis]|uniref:TF-B3 domain-containing protein n=1 Tax=Coptis chinensis TaxID=261450 RepID=A0A835I2L1_9MAGN|nr:hypothetical protein IFM89_011891 [Coptis chinensis]
MGRKPKHKPSFFKIMISTDKLRIPPAFVKHFNVTLPKKLILKTSSSAARWIVKLEKVNEYLFFGKGWDGFLNDNSIEIGDLLVFRLIDDAKLYVRIYEKTACEKETIIGRRSIGKCATANEKTVTGSDNSESHEVQSQGFEQQGHGVDEVSVDSKCQSAEPRDTGSGCSNKKGWSGKQSSKGCLSSVMIKRRPVTFKEKRLFEAELQSKSDYPLFIVTMAKTSLQSGFMFLPTSFARTYLPTKKRCDARIVDSKKQRTWFVKYSINSSRAYFHNGWSTVVSQAGLKPNDICSFELIDEENIKLKLSVLKLSNENAVQNNAK